MVRFAWATGLVLISSLTSLAQEAETPPQPRVVTIEAFGQANGEGNVIISRIGGDAGGAIFTAPLMMGGEGFRFVPDDELGISSSEQYQDELGLVPEQKEKLATLRKEIQERRNSMFKGFRPGGPENAGQLITSFENQIREDVKKRLNDILLPHQFDRMKQIRVQSKMRNQGIAALSKGDLADALALTDKQKTDLVEKQQKADRELREKIEALRKELYKDVMDDVLTAEQRDKLAKLTGVEVRPKPLNPQPAPKLKSGE